ncbi:MAG: nitronate monooxygenase [Rhodobacteraceae bacterium]|nr:nitronate monooxygenase [Paracoccaceae bacterium]
MWPDNRLTNLFNIQNPIIQAPMAGASGSAMAIATSKAGGLGSLPCAMLSIEKMHTEMSIIRQKTKAPMNVNFFVYDRPLINLEKDRIWLNHLSKYYTEFNLQVDNQHSKSRREPFNEAAFGFVDSFRPEVVSFHFGLPETSYLDRLKKLGCKIMSSATTVEEACWLEKNGCDVIIAQGFEAGGHRAMFLTNDINTQVGTMALVPQVVDAVSVPVIAAGGIADGRGIVAAFALGAAGVQIGTPYLFTKEALISEIHLSQLKTSKDNDTAITNLFSGRPARGIINRLMQEVGPMSEFPSDFPAAGTALDPLKNKAEAQGNSDFSSLWSGQSAGLCKETHAEALTNSLATGALKRFKMITSN